MPILPHKPDAPQPVRPDLLLPRLASIARYVQGGQMLCLDLHDGALSPMAAGAFGVCLDTIQTELTAMREAMRLKVLTLDCLGALSAAVPPAGISESALYQQLYRRGFRARDMRDALQAMLERGDLMRIADAERPAGKRGPKPQRIIWRKHAEATP